ncbi:hypothetical protein [Neorhodopirellula pilleata]|nr:hypothetical protein [Neorhodopirellula pilleata]
MYALIALAAAFASSAVADQPNVIVIMTEDQGMEPSGEFSVDAMHLESVPRQLGATFLDAEGNENVEAYYAYVDRLSD